MVKKILFAGLLSSVSCLLSPVTAQPASPPSTGALSVNTSTGAITAPVSAALFRSANSLAASTATVTIGSTAIALGGTSTTLAGLTSVTSTSFLGALTGNASTATALATPRTINGTSFDGTANITVTAAAGTLTGATLASNVLASSLTSVGTLTGGATGAGFTVALGSSTITGTLGTTNGGTGLTSFTSGGLVQASSTSALTTTLTPSGLTSIGVNSLTSAASTDLTLGTGTYGAAATIKSASGNLLIGTTTDMSGSGGLKVAGTTAATTTTSGALQVAGGVGVEGSIFSRVVYPTATQNDSYIVVIRNNALAEIGGFYADGTGRAALYLKNASSTIHSYIDGVGNTQLGGTLTVSGTTEATTGGAGSLTTAGGIYATKKIITASTFTSAAGVTFDIGAANVVSPTSPNRTITVSIGGTTYYLAAKTTND